MTHPSSPSEEKQIGLIAQEVEEIFPEIVIDDQSGYKKVDYSKLTPVLIEAIKEQQIIIAQLKIESRKIRSEIIDLWNMQSRITALESIIQQFGDVMTSAEVLQRMQDEGDGHAKDYR